MSGGIEPACADGASNDARGTDAGRTGDACVIAAARAGAAGAGAAAPAVGRAGSCAREAVGNSVAAANSAAHRECEIRFMGVPWQKNGDTTPWKYVAAIGSFKEAAG
ncbi:hypothetical protein [Burkholderia pseudomallei]|uniref:hypothetical protein n=3 Tax=Burkholderia pseudomallei TaxID=28450 RepID=UPI001177538B|nr:hypothetical protein [Burkholderia pseudomallei]